MKAQLKDLHSPDLADLKGSQPEDPENFGILVQALIGPAGEDGEESFDIMVCTPAWLSSELASQSHLWGRHHLIVARYDFSAMKAAIEDLCSQAEAETWREIATLLAGFGQWEFENYQAS